MKLTFDGIENIHKEKVSSLKETLVTQHRSILSQHTKSQHTESYKSKLHEVLDQQSNLQIRLNEAQTRNGFLQEQLDEARNKYKIVSSELLSIRQTVRNKPSESSPLDLTLAASVSRNEQVSSGKLFTNKQDQVPTAVLVDVTAVGPLVDIT